MKELCSKRSRLQEGHIRCGFREVLKEEDQKRRLSLQAERLDLDFDILEDILY